MKILVYGIDGGDLEIMKTFDMPFFKQFLDENTNVDLTVDLHNRGWVEIVDRQRGQRYSGVLHVPRSRWIYIAVQLSSA